jgi:hypothetical protein
MEVASTSNERLTVALTISCHRSQGLISFGSDTSTT